ncbi:MAG: DUF2806 domain-containing protein [Alphaproteobacteria bacterium]|nr:DUF2806 domain-containing protein [Alphaproteobacteria bacterium]
MEACDVKVKADRHKKLSAAQTYKEVAAINNDESYYDLESKMLLPIQGKTIELTKSDIVNICSDYFKEKVEKIDCLNDIAEDADRYSKEKKMKSKNDKPIDPPWADRFINCAENAMNDKTLKEMLAKILAGEAADPGTYSFRTLRFIETVSKQDIEIIQKILSLVINGSVFITSSKIKLDEYGLDFETLLELESLGIISGVSSGLNATGANVAIDEVVYYPGSKKALRIVNKDNEPKQIKLRKILKITQLGMDLQAIIDDAPFNDNYFNKLKPYFIHMGFEAKILRMSREHNNFTVYNEEA